ncbi:MAG TPA: hypothetical protein VM487_04600 [Phycisphaerae bacterium]|nr:hypothetical protein [Phycisphaerae bacterium]
MAKLKPGPIDERDLVAYLNSHSDFAFEISVLNRLTSQGFTCEHSATYEDPITKKPRQFDLRAKKAFDTKLIRLAVECKHVGANYPLLISCMPRRDEESFHEVVYSVDPARVSLRETSGPRIPAFEMRATTARITGANSVYKPGQPVGKSCEQVGRTTNDELTGSDSGIFTKWSQALSSAQDLVDSACYDGENGSELAYLSVVVPVVVIPDGSLWAASYDSDGAVRDAPRQESRCPFVVRMQYAGGDAMHGMNYTISHVEFVTMSGLDELIRDLCGDDSKLDALFPVGEVMSQIKKQSND